MLVDAGAKLNVSAHGDGGTPLIMALFWGNRDAAEYLAAHGISPNNLRTRAGIGDVHELAKFFNSAGNLLPEAGDHRAFYRPHSGFPVWRPSNDPQEILDEAFVYAAKNRRIGALDFLLRHGARIDGDPYRGTALNWVATKSGAIDTAAWLLDNGADVNLKATFGGPSHGVGTTALQLAAQGGRMEMVQYLVSRGADPLIKDDLYSSDAIGHAAHFGHTVVADWLREQTGR